MAILKYPPKGSGLRFIDQVDWQREVYDDPHKYKIVCVGRRSGKSLVILSKAIQIALTKPKALCWIVLPTLEMGIDIFWQDLQEILSYMGMFPDISDKAQYHYKKNEHAHSVYFHQTKSKIVIKSGNDPMKLKGRALSFAGLDEYAIFPDKSVWKEAILPSLLPDSEVIIASTPKGYDEFESLFSEANKGTNPNYKAWQLPTVNPMIEGLQEKIEEDRLTMTPGEFRQEYEASFESFEGRAYDNFHREIHLQEFPIFYDEPLCLTMDFNRKHNASIVFQHIDAQRLVDLGLILPNNEYQEKIFICHQDFKENVNHIGKLISIDKYFQSIDWTGEVQIYGDASRQRSVLAGEDVNVWTETQDFSPNAYFYVPKINPYQQSRAMVVNSQLLNAKNQVGLLLHKENCKDTAIDLEKTVMLNDDSIDKSKENRGSGIGHLQDALGYAIHWIRKNSVYCNAECIIL